MQPELTFHASQQNPHDFVSHQLSVDGRTGRAYVKSILTARGNGRQATSKRELREFFATATVTENRALVELVGSLAQLEIGRRLGELEDSALYGSKIE
jgi:hypothetical protein